MTGNSILDSALILGGVGLFFGFVIAMVNKKFWVWEDPRIDEVEELLPSTNCGACGVPGCRAFAELVVAGEQQPSGCTVMGPDDIEEVASYLGVDAGDHGELLGQLVDDTVAVEGGVVLAILPRDRFELDLADRVLGRLCAAGIAVEPAVACEGKRVAGARMGDHDLFGAAHQRVFFGEAQVAAGAHV